MAKGPQTYEVEKVLNSKKENGNIYYQVKWVGYSESENTWEPLINLEACFDLVKKFEIQQKTKNTSSTKPTKTTPKVTKKIQKKTQNKKTETKPPAKKAKASTTSRSTRTRGSR